MIRTQETDRLRRVFDELPDPQLTPNAAKVLQARYLKKDEKGRVAEDPKRSPLARRHDDRVGRAQLSRLPEERVETWARRFYGLMADGTYMPNSPTLMNAGREMGMLSACFVLPVEDSIEGIFSSIKATALIQKSGGGTGFDFSRLRPRGDQVEVFGWNHRRAALLHPSLLGRHQRDPAGRLPPRRQHGNVARRPPGRPRLHHHQGRPHQAHQL